MRIRIGTVGFSLIGVLLFATVGGPAAAAPPAVAPTSLDHHCLHDCTGGGGGALACLQSCSYPDPAAPRAGGSGPWADPHNAFAPLRPAAPGTVIESGTGPASAVGTASARPVPGRTAIPGGRYVCINECVRNGYQSGLCAVKCPQ